MAAGAVEKQGKAAGKTEGKGKVSDKAKNKCVVWVAPRQGWRRKRKKEAAAGRPKQKQQ